MILKPTILIVDDQNDIHKNLKFAFEQEYNFLDAYSEREMWDILEKNIHDIGLVVLDLDLYNLGNYDTGLDIIKSVREKYKVLPIVVLTSIEGTNENQYRLKAIQNGANEYFYKGNYQLEKWKIPLELFIAKKTLLFIDDDGDFLKNVEYAFGGNIFNLILKNSCDTAIQTLIEVNNVDLILLDLDLGKGETSENLKTLKERFPLIPIVVISNKEKGEYIVPNANGFIYKGDFEANEWLNIFYKTINERKKSQEKTDAKRLERLQKILQFNTGNITEIVGKLEDWELEELCKESLEHEDLEIVKLEQLFRKNIQKKVIVTDFNLSAVDHFDNINWQLNDRINIIIGENGAGKTFLLQLLAAVLQQNNGAMSSLISPVSMTELLTTTNTRTIAVSVNNDNLKSFTTQFEHKKFTTLNGKIPILAIADIRFINKKSIFSINSQQPLSLVDDGAYFFLEGETEETRLLKFIDRLALYALEEKREKNTKPKFEASIFRIIEKVIHKLGGDGFTFYDLLKIDNSYFQIIVKPDKYQNHIPLQLASRGQISILAMFGLVYQYLFSLQERRDVKANKIEEEHGIVIIDEIDAHLHPKWQRKIVSLFLEVFPNVQFIFMAHSPHIVAGRKAGEVVRLELKDNQKYGLRQFDRSFIGSLITDIYDNVFEIHNLTDEKYYEVEKIWFERDLDWRSDFKLALKKLPIERTKTEESLLKNNEIFIQYCNVQEQINDFLFVNELYEKYIQEKNNSQKLHMAIASTETIEEFTILKTKLLNGTFYNA